MYNRAAARFTANQARTTSVPFRRRAESMRSASRNTAVPTPARPGPGGGAGGGRWRDSAMKHWSDASPRKKALYVGGAGAGVLAMSRRGNSSGSTGQPPASSSGGFNGGMY